MTKLYLYKQQSAEQISFEFFFSDNMMETTKSEPQSWGRGSRRGLGWYRSKQRW